MTVPSPCTHGPLAPQGCRQSGIYSPNQVSGRYANSNSIRQGKSIKSKDIIRINFCVGSIPNSIFLLSPGMSHRSLPYLRINLLHLGARSAIFAFLSHSFVSSDRHYGDGDGISHVREGLGKK